MLCVQKNGPEYGLHLNMRKTIVYPISLINNITPTSRDPAWPEGATFVESGLAGFEVNGDVALEAHSARQVSTRR